MGGTVGGKVGRGVVAGGGPNVGRSSSVTLVNVAIAGSLAGGNGGSATGGKGGIGTSPMICAKLAPAAANATDPH